MGAATLAGAAVGATGGLAGAAVAKIGLTGAEATATVLVPSSTVAAVSGAMTQMVENQANGDPINENVGTAAVAGAAGTAPGGLAGDKVVGLLTESPMIGEAGKLVGGKALGDTLKTSLQEGATQGISNSCVGKYCD